ncbi:MAG TPA: hypothetical protein HA360_04330 [Nanoarchaeota archaeon]|nr:hypothetical protein [Candidatus Woesearchaeota archaeon]HIH58505.1 hypothetical protein [Nanoarchaeota archaeon]HII14274.1 hypothetical protein [Nanoarchaeota archaeon]HIJ05036.1 hypothetical protein [Nanoarchaeota archaeon]
MKITLKSLEDLVITIVGEDVLPLVRILWGKNNISEFKIAEMLNVTVNQVRNMLYRLNEQNLVDFIRKKDKKKGWYIYYWSLNKKSIEGVLTKVNQKQLEDLKARLSREAEGLFYVCPMGCMRLQMEAAMEHEFRCQECGTLMKEQDNQKTVSNIKKMIIEREQELKEQGEEKIKKTSQRQARDKKSVEKKALLKEKEKAMKKEKAKQQKKISTPKKVLKKVLKKKL